MLTLCIFIVKAAPGNCTPHPGTNHPTTSAWDMVEGSTRAQCPRQSGKAWPSTLNLIQCEQPPWRGAVSLLILSRGQKPSLRCNNRHPIESKCRMRSCEGPTPIFDNSWEHLTVRACIRHVRHWLWPSDKSGNERIKKHTSEKTSWKRRWPPMLDLLGKLLWTPKCKGVKRCTLQCSLARFVNTWRWLGSLVRHQYVSIDVTSNVTKWEVWFLPQKHHVRNELKKVQ